ncbi:RHS repeat-associated protein [Chryseobacterium sp. SORGH_AS 447]|uniref:RHS repeat-associated core domain-containing protein n=1 Tax=Chryseobacterium sp. SORGH_AS_0447 TaxID=3041769 RepID=UPI00278A213E|nr:RHS repeat-associated core domain-containing protein [Chryseobacterium sp. SORGH_AS_0447]MDQ1163165.1 RHS repeat-associated protein [Chryseobacterium sp. SORGH_AS_0447]
MGNVRVSFARNSAGALQLKNNNDYYPFGMNHLKTGNSYFGAGSYVKYKFGGKELQETGMYDFGARIYMADVGRWFATDPMAEANPGLSVYRYGFNNPIMFTDPNGMLEQAQIDHMWNNSGTGVTSWSFNTDGSPKMNSYNPMEDSDINHLLAAFSGVASGGGSARISFFTGTATQTSYKIGNDLYGVGNFGQGHTVLIKNSNEHEKISLDGYISTVGNLNDFCDSTGKGLENAGLTRLGTNGRLYLPTANGRVFYGNQYVRTIALAKYGVKIGKIAGPIGNGLNVVKVGVGVYKDGGTYGHHAKVATAGVIGGTAGAWMGAKAVGALFGEIRTAFGPEGTAAGLIIGGIIGGFAGSYYGGEVMESWAR